MIVLLFVSAIVTASLGAYWAAGILLVMGVAYAYDLRLREQEARRRQDRRCRAELARREQEAKQ